jgi:hypothetical protein
MNRLMKASEGRLIKLSNENWKYFNFIQENNHYISWAFALVNKTKYKGTNKYETPRYKILFNFKIYQ